jgi:hypothetical protein
MTKLRVHALVIGCIVVAGIIGAGFWRSLNKNQASAKPEPIAKPEASKPQLAISLESGGRDAIPGNSGIQIIENFIKITNRSERPITINSIIINNEYDFTGNNSKLPIQLTIGGSVRFIVLQHFESSLPYYPATPKGYQKEIIFVDVKTDQGAVRVSNDQIK